MVINMSEPPAGDEVPDAVYELQNLNADIPGPGAEAHVSQIEWGIQYMQRTAVRKVTEESEDPND